MFKEQNEKLWKRSDINIGLVNKSYFNSGELDLNDRPYFDVFQLLGFEFELPLNKTFSLMGATNWAYEGDYGAYAEGLLGLKSQIQLGKTTSVYAKSFVGAAGGGGIDVGKGLMAHAYAGLSKSLNKKMNLNIGLGKIWVLDGNFSPKVLELGFQYKFTHLIKKSR